MNHLNHTQRYIFILCSHADVDGLKKLFRISTIDNRTVEDILSSKISPYFFDQCKKNWGKLTPYSKDTWEYGWEIIKNGVQDIVTLFGD